MTQSLRQSTSSPSGKEKKGIISISDLVWTHLFTRKSGREIKCTSSLFLAILLVLGVVGVVPAIKAQLPSASALWVEPGALNFDTAHTHVGDGFNVTVWASTTSNNVFSYQVKVTYDPTMLNVTRVEYTASSTSAWWAGHATIAVTPIVDYVHGSVSLGETLLGQDAIGASNGSICSITFQIIAAPTQGSALTSLIDTDHPSFSFLLDPYQSVMPNLTLHHAVYTFSAGGPPPLATHQVGIARLSALSDYVNQSDALFIEVEALNNGTVSETFDVNVTSDGILIWEQTVDTLAAGNSQTLTFYWNTAGVALGNHTITAAATPVEGQTDMNNIFKTMTIQVTPKGQVPAEQHNTTVFTDPPTVQSTAIGQNFTVNINVSDVPDLYTWQTGIMFDSDILNLTGFREGGFLKTSGGVTISVQNSNLTACSLIGSELGITGSGQLAYATFTSVGIGVSDFHLTDVILLDSKLNEIAFKTVESFTVPLNGTNYQVKIADNLTAVLNPTNSPVSGVFDPTFNMSDKKISFNAVATKDWFCQVSLPKQLIKCNATSEWAVKIDGVPASYDATENATFTTLYFTHDKGNHTVEIIGTETIGIDSQSHSPPENPGSSPQQGNSENLAPPPLLVIIAASLSLITLMVALVDFRRTRGFKAPSESLDKPSS